MPMSPLKSKALACTLHKHCGTLEKPEELKTVKWLKVIASLFIEKLDVKMPQSIKVPPFEEPDDDSLFRELAVIQIFKTGDYATRS